METEELAPTRNSHPRLDLTEALKLLNSNERAAVLLCCQNGLSHEEAAQVLDSRHCRRGACGSVPVRISGISAGFEVFP
jgi:ketopantoate reductase